MSRHTIIPSRVLIVISTVVVALVLLLASSVQATPELPVVDDTVTASYKVHSGDNLWDIAAEHTPAGHDIRNTIERIKSFNNLESSMIQPGQLLEIPLLDSTAATR